jgi:hypothetical protein
MPLSKKNKIKRGHRKSVHRKIYIPWGILRHDPILRLLKKDLKTPKTKREMDELIVKYGGKTNLKQLVVSTIRKHPLSYSGILKSYADSLDMVNYILFFSGIGIPLLAFTVPTAILLKLIG